MFSKQKDKNKFQKHIMTLQSIWKHVCVYSEFKIKYSDLQKDEFFKCKTFVLAKNMSPAFQKQMLNNSV
jgi:hypothetical protein